MALFGGKISRMVRQKVRMVINRAFQTGKLDVVTSWYGSSYAWRPVVGGKIFGWVKEALAKSLARR